MYVTDRLATSWKRVSNWLSKLNIWHGLIRKVYKIDFCLYLNFQFVFIRLQTHFQCFGRNVKLFSLQTNYKKLELYCKFQVLGSKILSNKISPLIRCPLGHFIFFFLGLVRKTELYLVVKIQFWFFVILVFYLLFFFLFETSVRNKLILCSFFVTRSALTLRC